MTGTAGNWSLTSLAQGFIYYSGLAGNVGLVLSDLLLALRQSLVTLLGLGITSVIKTDMH